MSGMDAGRCVVWGPLPPPALSIVIAVDDRPVCRSVVSQWQRQYSADSQHVAWFGHYAGDLVAIHRQVNVRFVEVRDWRGCELPMYRFGYGTWSRFQFASFCHCGCFIPSLRYVVDDYCYEISPAYIRHIEWPWRHPAPPKPVPPFSARY